MPSSDRPTLVVAAANVYCGCDAKIYESVNAGPFEGMDVGKNDRCELTAGVNWGCGEWILCGQRPCHDPAYNCYPPTACDGHNNHGE